MERRADGCVKGRTRVYPAFTFRRFFAKCGARSVPVLQNPNCLATVSGNERNPSAI